MQYVINKLCIVLRNKLCIILCDAIVIRIVYNSKAAAENCRNLRQRRGVPAFVGAKKLQHLLNRGIEANDIM